MTARARPPETKEKVVKAPQTRRIEQPAREADRDRSTSYDPDDANPIYQKVLDHLAIDTDTRQVYLNRKAMALVKACMRHFAVDQRDPVLAAAGVCRAVGAMEDVGHTYCSVQVLGLWIELIQEVALENRDLADKMQVALTGAEDTSRYQPLGNAPLEEGALKGSVLSRPLRRRHGRYD